MLGQVRLVGTGKHSDAAPQPLVVFFFAGFI